MDPITKYTLPTRILQKCMHSILQRLHTVYIEKGGNTSISSPTFKEHIQWYMEQGKKVVYVWVYSTDMFIVFQEDDGSYTAAYDFYMDFQMYNRTNETDVIRIRKKSGNTTVYYRMKTLHDFGNASKLSQEDTRYKWFGSFSQLDLNVNFTKIVYHAYHSQMYTEEIWQKACHPNVVEKVIASYPSLEAFVDDPDAITPVSMLRATA
jgi:hypothetical protein